MPEDLTLNCHHGLELLLGIGVERRQIDDVLEPAASRR